jgi:hypothetical protein
MLSRRVNEALEVTREDQRLSAAAIRYSIPSTGSNYSAARRIPDWLETTAPERWRFDGGEKTYDWYGTSGDTSL